MTKEQRKLSQMNKEKAQKYFELTGELPKDRGQFEYVLHHVDESLRHNDIERYIQWNPEDLVVMKYGEHTRHHNLGRPKSESAKKKISNTLKGRKQSQETIDKRAKKLKGHPFYGGGRPKGSHLTDEHKRKISESCKGTKLSEETKKRMSEARKGVSCNKGRHWFTDGERDVFTYECPEGFIAGRINYKRSFK